MVTSSLHATTVAGGSIENVGMEAEEGTIKTAELLLHNGPI
jgi:hypothetical protein